MTWDLLLSTLDATIRFSTPLLLACLAGLYSERAGVFDIGLEGKMLMAAFCAAAVAVVTANAWLGLLAAIAISLSASAVQGAAAITFKGNQLITGVAVNMIALGLTALFGGQWFGEGGRTPQVPSGGRFSEITLPFAAELHGVPVIGPIYYSIVSGQTILAYVAFLAVPITWFVLFRTRFGLRLRAVGENPKAVDTAGISVDRLRFSAVLITGFLCGFAGAFFSIAQGAGFTENMTAGKGFIALAALIFAKWRPVPAMFTCLLFGFLDALQIRLQGGALPFLNDVPKEAISALPYVLTVVLLAGFIGKAVGPKAGGVPYTKER